MSEADSLGQSFYVVSFDAPSAGESRSYSARSTVLQVPTQAPTANPEPNPEPTAPPTTGSDPEPTAPTALSAQRNAAGVDLMWSGATDDVAVEGYNLYRDGAYLVTVFGTSHSDTSAVAGTAYDYYLVAFDEPRNFSPRSPVVSIGAAVGSTAIVGVTTPEPSPQPTPEPEPTPTPTPTPEPEPTPDNDTEAPERVNGLTLDSADPSQVIFSWQEDTSDASLRGYNVYRDGNYLATVFNTTYTDNSVPDANRVDYTVVAFDSAPNFSVQSQVLSVTLDQTTTPANEEVPPTLPDPNAPPIPGVSLSDPFNSLLDVDNEAAVAGGPPTTPKNLRIDLVSNDWAEINWAPSNDDGEVVAYNVYRSDGVVYEVARDATDLNSGAQAEIDKFFSTTAFIDCNFTRFFDRVHNCGVNQPIPGETYSYEVTAIDDDGQESPASNSISITYHLDRGAPVPFYQDPFLDGGEFAQRNDLSETRFFLDEFDTMFEDEFNGTQIDETKWTTGLVWGDNRIINGEQQYFVNPQEDPNFGYNPFTFTGSSLIIEAIPVPEELRPNLPPVCDEIDPTGLDRCEFLSGALSSHADGNINGGHKYGFIYGYVESRLKVSGTPGALSSNYLYHRYPGEGVNRHGPEIDIIEYLGENPFGDEDAFQTYHYQDPDTGLIRSAPTMSNANPDGSLYSGDFHTYGVLWEPSLVIWYIDGVEIKRLTGPQVSRQPMNIVNYLVAGSAWAPTPDVSDPSLFPIQFEVDYIRVMQRDAFQGTSSTYDPAVHGEL